MRGELAAKGTQLAFVHLGDAEQGQAFLAGYGLADVPHFSDPEARLYQAFGLRRASIGQILNRHVLRRGYDAFFHGGHGVGIPSADTRRMPGVFLVHKGEILRSFRHETVADRPDYNELATCPLPSPAK